MPRETGNAQDASRLADVAQPFVSELCRDMRYVLDANFSIVLIGGFRMDEFFAGS